MSDAGDGRTTPPSMPRAQPGAGWYPDFWTPSRRRYWNGLSWTFATTDKAQIDDPAPPDALALPGGHGLPTPVDPRRAPTTGADAEGPPAKPRQKAWKWILAVVVGLLVGVAGVALTNRSSSDSASPPPTTSSGGPPTTGPSPGPSVPRSGSPAGNDPSAPSLLSLVVQPEDVPSTATVAVFPGGIGLDQPTLDLCNGNYPSESLRTARVQDAVVDEQGALVLSTEAVLYGDSGGTTQALSELRSVVAACPSTPVPGPLGSAASTTTFNPAPDGSWPQTPSVNRVAYDLVTDDGSGPPRRIVAVYLQRGRALLGVYFSRPEGPQVEVEGQTTMEGIVGVFASRLAALPTSVVGA